MKHIEKYSFYFHSTERATEAISLINSIFCDALFLCSSSLCACEFEKGERICKTYTLDTIRPIVINEGPEWTMIYIQDENILELHFYYYGPKVENEYIILNNELAKFQYSESIIDGN